MRILQAQHLGLCFGVRDALAVAYSQQAPESTTIHGDLVHNEVVLAKLRNQGFAMLPEAQRDTVPSTDRVLITAHGISDRERHRLVSAGKQLVDTTCPLVARAHAAALRLARDCQHVVVLGKPGHVEVQGLVGDLPSVDVVSSTASVRHYGVQRLGVLCQTTFPTRRARRILRAIEALNPRTDVRFVDTVCHPTKQRIEAVLELLPQVDAVVVVGGASSNNTKELVRMCRRYGKTTHHVQGPADLRAEWFRGCRTVGLTAGTSTMDETVNAVFDALTALPAAPAP